MAASPETVSMAMFCDFENVALGVRDANYEKFDIKPVLERLLLKGSIVLKKAYCDWDRYKAFKAGMHEANFELIEIPHVRQSGKNSADIRMVVDALDLCYTKSHVNTFVIVSGDSDFSPLVSKLRENAKYVIGVGVKQSTSDLLIANCDEFIFYDDLVRENQRKAARRDPKAAQPVSRRSPEELEARKSEAIELALETLDALVAERGDSSKIWASMLKEAIKRRKPDFNESYFGFRSFGNLLEEAQTHGLLELGRDEKSGAFVSRGGQAGSVEMVPRTTPVVEVGEEKTALVQEAPKLPADAEATTSPRKRRSRSGGKRAKGGADVQAHGLPESGRDEKSGAFVSGDSAPVLRIEPAVAETPVVSVEAEDANSAPAPKRRGRGGNKRQAKEVEPAPVVQQSAVSTPAEPVVVAVPGVHSVQVEKAEKKPATRNRRSRKPKAATESA